MPIDPSIQTDYNLLVKYQKSRDVETEDISNLNRLASIGLIRKSVDVRNRRKIAIITDIGKSVIIDLAH
jgi:hypothetical protein